MKLAALRRRVEALSKKYRRRAPTIWDVLGGVARPEQLSPADRALVASMYGKPDASADFLERLIEEARRPQTGFEELPPTETQPAP